MADDHIPRVVIVGGGVAGWMAAAAFANAFKGKHGKITLIDLPGESAATAGEAALPTIRVFNDKLGIDENEFIRRTRATFMLGTRFEGWSGPRKAFFHPFGQYGTSIETVGFHHCWFKMRGLGDKAGLEEYSLAGVAASRGRFARPSQDASSVFSSFSYGFHLDRDLYRDLLRDYALTRGVTTTLRNMIDVKLRGEDGFIDALILDGCERIAADLYIDCTGSTGLLIGGGLQSGYEDWSHWLPCDRAVAVRSASPDEMPPLTRISAREHGWQRSIPMQHCSANDYIYSSRFASEQDANDTLLGNIAGPALHEPMHLRFINGRRTKFWDRNCISLGAAAGFLEPLESTAIHQIQSGLARLFQLLPGQVFDRAAPDEYNRLTGIEFDHIRDFLLLHYHANGRTGSALWEHCRSTDIPDSLAYKMELFRSRGRVIPNGDEIFFLPNWLSIFVGLDILPRRYHPFADGIPAETLKRQMQLIKIAIRDASERMPDHRAFLAAIIAQRAQG